MTARLRRHRPGTSGRNLHAASADVAPCVADPSAPRPGSRVWSPAAAVLVGLALAACRSGAADRTERTPDLPGAVKVPASQFPLDRPTAPTADPAGPISHVGRTVFARCHRMVVAQVVSVSPAGAGAEVLRVGEQDVIWGDPDLESAPYTVLCGAKGLAPAPGGSALFVLRLLPAGGFEALEVSPVDDTDGPARLRTLRTYVAIEMLPEPEERREALLAYLRSAVRSESGWARANAVREYAAFAEAFPSGLEPDDAAALSKAIPNLQDANLKRLAQSALDRAPVASRPKSAPVAGGGTGATPSRAVPGATADIEPFVRRYDGARTRPEERRSAVLDAAAKADRGAAPLVVRALADPDASVREAAAAAVGEVRIVDLVPRLISLAVTDASIGVRRTCVVALGHMRAGSAVDTLAGLASSDREVGREALFALARIRDDGALARLRRERDVSGQIDPDRRKLVDFLLSDDFVRQERAMGAKWTGKE
ncbi:MAG: HEAT repeat domain-containing protein [Planctomycetes bacterium]|nr:HEAT repeat domain-containing protein [Planctomycetota bacterium]